MPTTTGKKIAIVTGSALGLGYELASQLIANGWLVAGVDFQCRTSGRTDRAVAR